MSDFMGNLFAIVVDDTRKHQYHLDPSYSHHFVPPVLPVTLGIILKFFGMVSSEVRKLDCNLINEVQKRSENDWEAGNNLLMEENNEMYKLSDKLVILMDFKECFFGKLASNGLNVTSVKIGFP